MLLQDTIPVQTFILNNQCEIKSSLSAPISVCKRSKDMT